MLLDALEFSKVLQGTPGCSRVLQSAPECFRVLQSVLKCSMVLDVSNWVSKLKFQYRFPPRKTFVCGLDLVVCNSMPN